jgi:uncharacterized RDD family membrane protein YckC
VADVVTGEAVALDLPVANFPSRILALLLDMVVQAVLYLIIVVVVIAVLGTANADYLSAALLAGYVVVVVGYATTFETLSRGKTLGKMAVGLRVVGDDGSPERFRQALVRALIGVLEIWTYVLAPVGLVTSIASAKGKRVGDLFAGTYVVQERVPPRRPLPPAFAVIPPPLAEWAHVAQVAALNEQTADAAGSYLRRFAELTAQARETLGSRLAAAVAAQVSPPPPAGTPPAAYLAAVLAIRRQRDAARLALPSQAVPAQTVPPHTATPQAAPPQAVPSQTVPSQTVPSQTVPSQTVPSENALPPSPPSTAEQPGFAPPA